jgi:hypothetical protein
MPGSRYGLAPARTPSGSQCPMLRIRLFAFRLARHLRLTRVILIGDEIFTMVGGHVLTSVIVDTDGALLRRLVAS